MLKTFFVPLAASALALAVAAAAGAAAAQGSVKIGLVMPITGILGPGGHQAVAGARLYVAQHGDTVAGRNIELIIKDDGSMSDVAKRLAQELIVSERVAVLGGGVTPSVLAIAPLATASKTLTHSRPRRLRPRTRGQRTRTYFLAISGEPFRSISVSALRFLREWRCAPYWRLPLP
jgi:ABC-type branched-subunit amino acid transport system substrate-binding protein